MTEEEGEQLNYGKNHSTGQFVVCPVKGSKGFRR
jgi:hypothetical protein